MARPDPLARARHERAGRRAELAAEWWLRLKGYRILERRFRSGRGEIDLVTEKGRVIVFVEVKQRPTHEQGRLAVTDAAQRRIAAAAIIWLGRRRPDHTGDIRYDMITVARGLPRHQRDAFRPDTSIRASDSGEGVF